MNKVDLRNGMLAQMRDGAWGIIMKDAMMCGEYQDVWVNIENGEWMRLSSYDNSMKYTNYDSDEEYDIVKVAECDHVRKAINGIREERAVLDMEAVKVIWERSNPKVAEVESLIQRLQGQLKDAQEQLEALR
jgi:tRNA(Phe) wybutosine-synthesizing methylase Tyw3